MKIHKSRTTKAVAIALAAVLQVYASGGFALAAPEEVGAVVVAPSPQAQGRLTTTGDNPVAVNGNNARTGETIFSGQQIQTPAGTTATVQLPGLGSVEIRPGSNVTLTFGEGKINVVVISGCVRLAADAGVTGTVQSKGKTITTDSDDRVIEICDDAAGGVVPINTGVTPGVTAGGLSSGTATALTAGIVGAFAIIAHEFISDSENPEPPNCTPIPGTTSPLTPPSGCAP
ncbi:MAG: hypothetical protein ABW208_06160 [Pyrinomonadaceae bacterium]